MNYYNEIKNKLIDNEVYEKVKDYSKERHRVITYYEIGKLLSEAGNKYGENIIGKYAEKLQVEVGKKYDKTMLTRMRQLFYLFNNQKVAPVVQLLSWSQCLQLLPLKNENKINYYIKQTIDRKLSKRGLEEIIKNKEYERLPDKTKRKLIADDEEKIEDFIKNPIVIKNPNNIDVQREKVLQGLILENIDSFLKELGNGFTYVEHEYKIMVGNKPNYIDILLYNIKFRCYVVVELKVTELKKEHIGQIEIYMNYIDKNIKSIYEDKTIGIIICKRDNKYILGYCSDKRILSKEYKIIN